MTDSAQAPVCLAVLRSRVLRTLATLAPLARVHEACGASYEALRDALAGVGGVTAAEFYAIEKMAQRWRSLDPRLQSLFVQRIEVESVRVAIWYCVLDPENRTDLITDYTTRTISNLWAEEFGCPPSIVLFPRRQR